jgi:hypothetical protein
MTPQKAFDQGRHASAAAIPDRWNSSIYERFLAVCEKYSHE